MKKKYCFTDFVLTLLGVGTVLFIIAVLWIFSRIGDEPSTLVTGFFSFVTAEAAICWRIYAHKHKINLKPEGTTATDILEGIDLIADPNENDGGEG